MNFKYHLNLTEHFKSSEKVWQWFASQKVKDTYKEEFKSSLLKNTYRLSNESDPEVYELVEKAASILNIDKKVTIYQELNSLDNNARVSIDDEVAIVFGGTLLLSLIHI